MIGDAVSRMDGLREQVTTTPGRLLLLSIVLVAGAVCFGVVATGTEQSRARAARAVGAHAEPLLVQAEHLYSAFSDANATATTTFLTGGLEPPARRARYVADLRLASRSLDTLTADIGALAGPRNALGTITVQVPVYSGLVDAARADNRLGLPVGAAYMRRASSLMTGTILPAAEHVFATEARRLNDDYLSGTAAAAPAVLVVAAIAGLALLVLIQVYLARISHRILNLPVLLGTIVFTAVSVGSLIAVTREGSALATAQHDGSDPVEVLSATTVLFSRAQSDESLMLVNRGSDETDPADFAAVMRALAPNGGLIGDASTLAVHATSATASRLALDFAAYKAQAARIALLEGSGELGSATSAATSPSSAAIADRLSADLTGQIAAAQTRFSRAASRATSSLSGWSVAIPVLTAVFAALALVGLRQRLNDYR